MTVGSMRSPAIRTIQRRSSATRCGMDTTGSRSRPSALRATATEGTLDSRSPPAAVARLHYQKGADLAPRGNPEAAIAEWRTAIVIAPAHSAPYFAIADLYERGDQIPEAIKTLDALKRANPLERHVSCKQAELLMNS